MWRGAERRGKERRAWFRLLTYEAWPGIKDGFTSAAAERTLHRREKEGVRGGGREREREKKGESPER